MIQTSRQTGFLTEWKFSILTYRNPSCFTVNVGWPRRKMTENWKGLFMPRLVCNSVQSWNCLMLRYIIFKICSVITNILISLELFGYFELTFVKIVSTEDLKVKVNFEIYIADRKATTCILAKLFLLRCVNPAALHTGTLLLDSPSPEGS